MPGGEEPQRAALSLAGQRPEETGRWVEVPGESSSAPLSAPQMRKTAASYHGKKCVLAGAVQLPTGLAGGTCPHPGSGLRAPPGGSAAQPPASLPGHPARPAAVPAGFQKSLQPVCFKIDTALHYTSFDLHTHTAMLLLRSVR